MKNIYTAYVREVNGKSFFFVKKYVIYNEYDHLPGILDSMGMHTDFYKACEIAKVNDEAAISKLLNELPPTPAAAKVIRMHGVKAITHSLLKNTQQAILKLRLAGFN
jgi:hypothetical protein